MLTLRKQVNNAIFNVDTANVACHLNNIPIASNERAVVAEQLITSLTGNKPEATWTKMKRFELKKKHQYDMISMMRLMYS